MGNAIWIIGKDFKSFANVTTTERFHIYKLQQYYTFGYFGVHLNVLKIFVGSYYKDVGTATWFSKGILAIAVKKIKSTYIYEL